MVRWFKSWLEAWRLARMAKTILADPSVAATVHVQGILLGLAARKNICRHCFQPFEPKERTFAERFQLRAILVIRDAEPDPMLCDNCFNVAVGTYNPQATNIGTSNSGPRNVVLKELG
jgi:hypothetical protein